MYKISPELGLCRPPVNSTEPGVSLTQETREVERLRAEPRADFTALGRSAASGRSRPRHHSHLQALLHSAHDLVRLYNLSTKSFLERTVSQYRNQAPHKLPTMDKFQAFGKNIRLAPVNSQFLSDESSIH
jgi:hypothetical protein